MRLRKMLQETGGNVNKKRYKRKEERGQGLIDYTIVLPIFYTIFICLSVLTL